MNSLALLWALVVGTTTVITLTAPIQVDNGQLAYAAVSCADGHPTYHRPADAPERVDAHELAHAWHCHEAGSLYAPPPEFPYASIPERPDTYLEAWRLHGPVPWYCWSGLDSATHFDGDLNKQGPLAEAEWFACMMERSLPQPAEI